MNAINSSPNSSQHIDVVSYQRPTAQMICVAPQANTEKELSELLDQDTFFRFGYIPFVIAELVWDYADTAIDLAVTMKHSQSKKLCRRIRELRKEYIYFKKKYFDSSHLESEIDNMETFYDELNDFFKTYFQSYVDKLVEQYPDLSIDNKMLISEAYLCKFTLNALFKYMSYIKGKVENIVRHPIGDILPKSIYQLNDIILGFATDNPIRAELIKKEDFVDELVEQIKSIDLCYD